ncbi:hypothetical protein [Roseateles sp. LYH14W]|uniref:Uncharacterized protein n=1 Tax=Pelomonas parva TaxID=3299032 RepID=A0ABW7F4G1_9BURK
MADAAVRIIKFDAGSSTDKTLARMQGKLEASTGVEAMRRSLTIADLITDYTKKGQKIFVQGDDGVLRQLIIS